MRRDTFPQVQIAILGCLFAAASAGCLDLEAQAGRDPEELGESSAAVTLVEGFEGGTKAAYAVADVTLGTGVWRLDDALIGDTASDPKIGARSTRVRNSGKVTMRFDRSGAGTVTVRYASYGSDASGTWALFSSQNAGSTWTQVGSSRTSAAGALATATFTVDVSGAIRFELRKLDGGSNRINFDDISITDGGTEPPPPPPPGNGASVSVHTTLGLPTAASTSDPNDYLSVKSGYVISYNGSRKVPNWVSWQLNTTYLGSIDRQDDFRPDSTLPGSVAQASLADYSGSGYDRGHMCPSGDRTKTTTANSQTFYLSNMIPQAGNNNRGPWAALEEYSRSLVSSGKHLFVLSGGTFSGSSATIGNGVKVPDKTWKVIVVLDASTQGASAVSSSTRVIAVLMPNRDSLISTSANWRNYRVTVDSIEALTGQDYLSDVAASVQAVVESRVDNL